MDADIVMMVARHVLFIVGPFLFAKGLLGMNKEASIGDVLKSPVFWGMIIILIGFHTGVPAGTEGG